MSAEFEALDHSMRFTLEVFESIFVIFVLNFLHFRKRMKILTTESTMGKTMGKKRYQLKC